MSELKVDFSDFKKVLDALLVKRDENEWKLTISREMNCYLLEGMVEDITRKWSVEDDETDELKSHENLLWEVITYFGFGGSKWDEERIKIVREKKDD